MTIRATDRGASEEFYTLVLRTLGIVQEHSDDQFPEWDDFSLAAADDESPATRRLHIAFVSPSRRQVDDFWRAGTEAGYKDDGEPGERPQYSEDYYGAFLLDPDGNSAEAVHHGSMRTEGWIDHVWLRVADVEASKRFYELVAPFGNLRLASDLPQHARFVGDVGSFSLVPGEPTRHVHMAFPAADNDTVDEFHRTATRAGYRDHGAPGERPVYHPGYYGAYVLDPDGNNVEVVNHNR